ncbi:unnamed protein product [Nesidiocoris tenuis]|uniref:Chitin-binding type-2 domain-containing protein n=2 Tax=Nesidiocoris tenuis TaxID=355587 RepID=A0A6H5GIK8_9HEMI|nr:unnamed protein product [Nesidiocoris tenuis]
MSFVTAVALVAILGLAVIGCQADDKEGFCAKKEKGLYQEPTSGSGFFGAWNCMKYHECKDKNEETVHHCFFLVPLRLFDAKTKECTWFWKATCKTETSAPGHLRPRTTAPASPHLMGPPVALRLSLVPRHDPTHRPTDGYCLLSTHDWSLKTLPKPFELLKLIRSRFRFHILRDKLSKKDRPDIGSIRDRADKDCPA